MLVFSRLRSPPIGVVHGMRDLLLWKQELQRKAHLLTRATVRPLVAVTVFQPLGDGLFADLEKPTHAAVSAASSAIVRILPLGVSMQLFDIVAPMPDSGAPTDALND
jgi:hypothetical protein